MNTLLQNPFIQYIISPAIVFSIILFTAYKLTNLGEFKERFNKSLEDIKDFKKDMKRLTSNMDVVKTHLVTKSGLDANLFAAGSPLELLSAGKKLLNFSGFIKIYKDNKDWFIDEIKKYKPKTLADIDEASIKVLEKCKNDDKFADFKQIAFQNGVSIDVLLKTLSIYLRDEVSKEIL